MSHKNPYPPLIPINPSEPTNPENIQNPKWFAWQLGYHTAIVDMQNHLAETRLISQLEEKSISKFSERESK